MVKEKVTKEDWRNSGNNESQVKVECPEQSLVSPKDLNNMNRIADLRNYHQEQMILMGNKLRVTDQAPVGMIEHCRGIDVFNEYLRNIEILGKDRRSEGDVQKQELPKQGVFKLLQSVQLFQIDAIQVTFDTKIMDRISETHRIPRKQKIIQDSLIADKNNIVQMSKFHDKRCIMRKKDSGHQISSETIDDTSDISVVEDRLNALVDGIEPRTSFLLPVKKASHSSLPSHKQLYKLKPERQSEVILHRRNVKTIKTYQQECPLSSADDDELNIFRGTELCVIGMPNHQHCLETSKRLAILGTSCTCDSNSVNLNSNIPKNN